MELAAFDGGYEDAADRVMARRLKQLGTSMPSAVPVTPVDDDEDDLIFTEVRRS